MVQDVFLAAFKGLDKFRQNSSLKVWLMRITINISRSYQRKRLLRNKLAKTFFISQQTASPSSQPLLDNERECR